MSHIQDTKCNVLGSWDLGWAVVAKLILFPKCGSNVGYQHPKKREYLGYMVALHALARGIFGVIQINSAEETDLRFVICFPFRVHNGG